VSFGGDRELNATPSPRSPERLVPDSVALVTGGSRGIGRAISLSLAHKGHPVAVNYLSGIDAAKETVASIEEAGGEAISVAADVGDAGAVEEMFRVVEESLGPVAVLVNNAGTRADALTVRLTDDAWDRVLRTNLFGTFACCRRALKPMLRSRWGRIVNVTSVAGLRGSPGQANYSAAKAGVIALTRTLAREVGSRNITVNAVAPGFVDTDLTAGLPEDRMSELVSAVPQGRTGSPQDVANVVCFLTSDEAAYVTGSVFVADGGLTA
jgi:3-oxoacyl-[acyl-carrier protein] reductase